MMRVLKLACARDGIKRWCGAVILQPPVRNFVQSVELHDDGDWSSDTAVDFAQKRHENAASDVDQGLSVERSTQLMHIEFGAIRGQHAVVKQSIRSL